MKIRTYVAADMRQALRLVRDEQGPDAVILPTRTVNGTVEVVAAVDPLQAEADLTTATASAAVPPPPMAQAPAPELPMPRPLALHPAILERYEGTPVDAPAARGTSTPHTAATSRINRSGSLETGPLRAETRAEPVHSNDSEELTTELRSLRQMLENQLAQLAWNDLTRRAPTAAEVLKELTQVGLAQELCAELVAGLPPGLAFDDALRRTLALLARRVTVAGERWFEQGARLMFVGPTGAGKTTAIAKLAARWVMQHGQRDISLVSVDSTRIGAQQQTAILGRLLGVQAMRVEHPGELTELLSTLAGKRMILVDTAGVSPREHDLPERIEALQAAITTSRLETCLVLAANAQAGALEEAVQRFAPLWPATALVTRLDEAASLGGTLSTLIRAQLPVSYVTEGQRIPDDLSPARAHQLVARAVQLSKTAGALAGEDLLARRFGGVAHVIA